METPEIPDIDESEIETILVGQIGPARGLKGEVLVRPFTDQPENRFAVGETLYDQAGNTFTVVNFRVIKNRYCLTFKEHSDRNQAEKIRGVKLYADIVPEWETETDAYRSEELVGLAVLNLAALPGKTAEETAYPQEESPLVEIPEAARLGTVSDLLFGTVQDLLEVTTPEGEKVLVPFVNDLVPEIDLAGGYLICNPPTGLFPSPA